MDADVIDFKIPSGNETNLMISDIPRLFDSEEELLVRLQKLFSPFGLLYEVQVFNVIPVLANDVLCQEQSNVGYGFVKFYSTKAARKAKTKFENCLVMKGQRLKVRFANRRKSLTSYALPCVKCKELANYYLGFNGWNSKILMLKEADTKETETGALLKVQYVCLLQLEVIKHGVLSKGLGTWIEEYSHTTDCTSRGKAIGKCQKYAYNRAMENAFQRLVLVVLPNFKVWVDVDHRDSEHVLSLQKYEDTKLLQVNNLDHDPLDDGHDSEGDNSCMDQLLMDLENNQ